MRGRCNMLDRRTGEECSKPSVYSQPCQYDECDALAAVGKETVHLETHMCAEHYDLVHRGRRNEDDFEEKEL